MPNAASRYSPLIGPGIGHREIDSLTCALTDGLRSNRLLRHQVSAKPKARTREQSKQKPLIQVDNRYILTNH